MELPRGERESIKILLAVDGTASRLISGEDGQWGLPHPADQKSTAISKQRPL